MFCKEIRKGKTKVYYSAVLVDLVGSALAETACTTRVALVRRRVLEPAGLVEGVGLAGGDVEGARGPPEASLGSGTTACVILF